MIDPAVQTEPFDLTRARLNAGFTIKGLAREIGMGEKTIRDYENGARTMRPDTCKPLADFFGVQVIDLLPLDDADSRS